MLRTDPHNAPAAYVLAMAAWVYGFAALERALPPLVAFALLLGAAAVQISAGYAIGRWGALSLAVVPVVLALAAEGLESSLWVTLVVLMVFPGAPLIALGVYVRRWRLERDDRSPDGWLYGDDPAV
jgi:hypothetical protein